MLNKLDQSGVEHVIFHSDTCGSQNRNSILGAAIINFLCNKRHITVVEQKYFESGHSQMECDSMRSAIECAMQGLEINLPSDYQQCMQMVRRSQLYMIEELNHEDIWDYKTLSQRIISPSAFNGIMKIHHIKYRREEGDLVVTMATDIDRNMTEVKYWRRD